MSTLYAYLLLGGGGAALLALLIALVKRQGRLEAESGWAKREAEDAKRKGEVMAEHREKADTERRLGDGTF